MFSSLHLPLSWSAHMMLFSVAVWKRSTHFEFSVCAPGFCPTPAATPSHGPLNPNARSFWFQLTPSFFQLLGLDQKPWVILTFPSQPFSSVLANPSFKAYPDNLTMVLYFTQVKNWPIPSCVQLFLGSYLLLFLLVPRAQAIPFSFACRTYQTYYFRELIPIVPFTWNTWPQASIDSFHVFTQKSLSFKMASLPHHLCFPSAFSYWY